MRNPLLYLAVIMNIPFSRDFLVTLARVPVSLASTQMSAVIWAVVRTCIQYCVCWLNFHPGPLILNIQPLSFLGRGHANSTPGCPVFRNRTIVQQPANMLTLDDMYNEAATDFIKTQAG